MGSGILEPENASKMLSTMSQLTKHAASPEIHCTHGRSVAHNRFAPPMAHTDWEGFYGI